MEAVSLKTVLVKSGAALHQPVDERIDDPLMDQVYLERFVHGEVYAVNVHSDLRDNPRHRRTGRFPRRVKPQCVERRPAADR